MSEEIRSAAINVPRSMLISVVVNGCLGFAILLATLFCIGDYDTATAPASGYPFISILANGLGSNSATNFLVSAIIVLEVCSAIGALAASSRMTWSFARDHGLPGWKTLGRVRAVVSPLCSNHLLNVDRSILRPRFL
jgi:amino acid transporter